MSSPAAAASQPAADSTTTNKKVTAPPSAEKGKPTTDAATPSNTAPPQSGQKEQAGAAASTSPSNTSGAAASSSTEKQQAVNSNNNNPNYQSRRVTIGGMHGKDVAAGGGSTTTTTTTTTTANKNTTNTASNVPSGAAQQLQQQLPPSMNVTMANMLGGDVRRSSMSSTAGFGNMDEFFGRRPSLGFDTMGMDSLFGRRESLDSTTAALDAAIMDLSRRRYSVAMGGMPPPTGPDLSGGMNHPHHPGFMNPPFSSAAAAAMLGSSTSGGAGGGAASSHESITQRQQQLQQQQRELENRQKELEMQRQALIATMQERSYMSMPPHPHAGAAAHLQGGGLGGAPHRGSMGMGMAAGSLGLGSVHSQGSGSLGPPTTSMSSSQQPTTTGTGSSGGAAPHRSSGATTTSAASGGNGSSGQQWWICQICNSKAFASHEEAMTHEAICQEGGGPRLGAGGTITKMDPMHPLPYSQDLMPPMGRNFSMGLGSMDTSGRGGMSLAGFGGMDNSSRGVVSMGMDSSRGGSIGLDSSRNMSLGMDSSSGHHSYHNERALSMGPFAMLQQPMPLSMESDKNWLTPLHCFVRMHCVEVFTASESDVATPSKGKRKPIQVGQVGIRCPHCHSMDSSRNGKARERGSVYYPTTISSIYNATMNLLQRHLHSCPAVPDDIMRRYETLKADDARSGTSKRYWVESALSLGLVDTPNGIRHSALRPPPLPTLTSQQESTGQSAARRSSNELFSSKSNAAADTKDGSGSDEEESTKADHDAIEQVPLVTLDDKPYATTFSYNLLSQMQPCVFTEADRLGKRKGLPPGFPGLACSHCFGGYGSGRFFPSSIKTLSDTSKTLNVLHNHMMRCRKCPADVKESLEKLRGSHDDERAKMKFGSQKAFFARIWERLHGKDHPGSYKRALAPSPPRRGRQQPLPIQQQHHMQQQQGFGPPPQHMHRGGQQHIMQGHANGPPPPPPIRTSGLDTLASVSNPSPSPPSKRQKTELSEV